MFGRTGKIVISVLNKLLYLLILSPDTSRITKTQQNITLEYDELVYTKDIDKTDLKIISEGEIIIKLLNVYIYCDREVKQFSNWSK